ncbi:MAG: ATP-binding protein [Gammaproteobacteria bacterium]
MSGNINKTDLSEALKQIGAQAERAAKIIRRIRNFSRGVEPERTLADISQIIHDVAVIADFETRRHNISMNFATSSEALPVVVDRIQINQVLWNLIINAIEAITSSNSTRREIEFSSSRIDENYAEIAVRDTGPGLANEDLQCIFDAFFTRKPEGMGMGLAISRSIVESHGGHIWVARNSDCGLTFHVKLPLAKESMPHES